MNITPPSFSRSGRPRRIGLSDLFLWDVAIEIEVSGYSLSELLGEENPKLLSLYQDVRRKKRISIERAMDIVPTALDQFGLPWAPEFRKALNGEESSFSNLGSWQCYIYAMAKVDETWPPQINAIGQHFIAIEEALKAPTLAWQQDDLYRCADILEACPALAPYLWPGAVDRLRNAKSIEKVTELRAMVMLELMLSYLAAWDAQTCADGFSDHAVFDRIFPDLSTTTLAEPNALYFDWLEVYSGTENKLATFIPQISKPEKDSDIGSSRRQLRRWKSGEIFPSNDVLDAMFRKLYGYKANEKDDPRRNDWYLSWRMATATRRISFMMGIIGPLSRFREPVFPFGFESIQEWRTSRYPHWYKYWLALIQTNN